MKRNLPHLLLCVGLLFGYVGGLPAAPVPSTGYSWETTLNQSDWILTYSFDHAGGYTPDRTRGYMVEGSQTESLDQVFSAVPQWENLVREALDAWSPATAINFVEVPDSNDNSGTPGAQGVIRLSAGAMNYFQAWAMVPTPTGTTEADLPTSVFGDVTFDSGYTWDSANHLKLVAMHELGHALGLVSHNLNPGSMMFDLGVNHITVSGPSEQDLADIRAIYFPQNAPAPVLTEASVQGERDWFAIGDGTAATPVTVTITGTGRIITTGEQKTGIKGVGAALANKNYGFDHVNLTLAADGQIQTDGHNAYGIASGDRNTITVDGFISTAGYSADGVALLGQDNVLRTGAGSLIRTSGASGNGIYIGLGSDDLVTLAGNQVVAGGRIETTGDGGAGIYVLGYSAVTLDGSIATTGTYAAGIGSDQYGYLDIAVAPTARIETRGDNGFGIFLRGLENQLIMNGRITSSGAQSHGIYLSGVEANDIVSNGPITTSGEGAIGIYLSGDVTDVASAGSIDTSGERGYGVEANGDNNQLENSGAISTSGDGARGLYIYGDRNAATSSGSIATSGKGAYGLYAHGEDNQLENSGSITTLEEFAIGLNLNGDGNAAISNGSIAAAGYQAYAMFALGDGNRLVNSGMIDTTGEQSYGLIASGDGNQLVNSGIITTMGNLGYGMFASGAGNQIQNSGQIVTSGAWSHGMVTSGGSNVLVHAGIIETSGEHAFGLFAREGDNVVDVFGDVTGQQAAAVRLGGAYITGASQVEQTGATGNRLLLHGSPKLTGDIVNDGANNGSMVYFGIALNPAAPAGYAPAPTALSYNGNFIGQSWVGEIVTGSVWLNGTNNAFSLFTIDPGATLGGSTTLTGDLVNHGRIAPGNSHGNLAVGGNYQQSAGAILQMEVGAHKRPIDRGRQRDLRGRRTSGPRSDSTDSKQQLHARDRWWHAKRSANHQSPGQRGASFFADQQC